MAALTGISGMQMGDGAGGKIALDLQTRVLRILYSSGFTYMTASILNPGQIAAGSVSFQIPEILKTEDYRDGTTKFQTLNSNLVEVPINIRRTVKYTYETFDRSRLGSMDSVIGAIANSVAMAIQNDLNFHFWEHVSNHFKAGAITPEFKQQMLVLPELNKEDATVTEIKNAVKKLQWKTTQISKTYNKLAMGVEKAELMIFFDPFVDINIRQIYDNQPNSLGKRWVANNLEFTQLGGGVSYALDKFLGMNFAANQSFTDKALDLSDYVGFIIHNEAIAMPFNFSQMVQVTDQENANPRFIAKYQFGIGTIRPWLVYAITKTIRR